MDEWEAILQRLKSNQAYNDHIVSQQSKIVSQFNKVEELDKNVTDFGIYIHEHSDLILKNEDAIKEIKYVIDRQQDNIIQHAEYIANLANSLQDVKKTYDQSILEILEHIKLIKNDLQALFTDNINDKLELNKKLSALKTDIANQLKDGLAENLKQIPETPPYIKDLKDTVTHKLRVFENEVGKAIDKANHAEMLYKVVEKRTRQVS